MMDKKIQGLFKLNVVLMFIILIMNIIQKSMTVLELISGILMMLTIFILWKDNRKNNQMEGKRKNILLIIIIIINIVTAIVNLLSLIV